MPDIDFSTGSGRQVSPIDPDQFEGYDVLIASGADMPGDGEGVFFNPTSGYAQKSSAAVEATSIFAGVLVQKQGLGATMLVRGRIGGFDVDHMNYGSPIFASDEPGKLSDEPGTIELQVGVVVPMSDKQRTKVVFIYAPFWHPPAPPVDAGDDE